MSGVPQESLNLPLPLSATPTPLTTPNPANVLPFSNITADLSGQPPSQPPLAPGSQPPYVADFTRLVEIMAANQARFEETMAGFNAHLDGQLNLRQPAASSGNTSVAPPLPSAIPSTTVKLPSPRKFNGKHQEVLPFLNEVKRIIEFAPASFPDDRTKIFWVSLYLKDGIPLQWFNYLETSKSPALSSWELFLKEFSIKFEDPCLVINTYRKLNSLRQTGSAHDYFTQFLTLSDKLDMTEQSKISRFYDGLKSEIKDNLVSLVDRPSRLADWQKIIVQIDANLTDRERDRTRESRHVKESSSSTSPLSPPVTPTPVATSESTSSDVAPMDIDALTSLEHHDSSVSSSSSSSDTEDADSSLSDSSI
ncbi:hypothetical protein D9613_012720 [Agrocybe pediades]|uniref:Retrotransposon gag domain-containing protein n=1 Tax=Agrocybe pediades TaxID=84607 RepID=A0A8H4VLM6_9AGAR|nr:hypothetical protein D9613_012720 [Agrocybe pediades]